VQDLVELWRPVPPLASIETPALALVSTGRHFTDPLLVQQVMAAMPRLTMKRIEALHWIPTEQPQAMREAIDQWCGRL
jgi:pimeloyl-ACP methyl ester carboxylesterase